MRNELKPMRRSWCPQLSPDVSSCPLGSVQIMDPGMRKGLQSSRRSIRPADIIDKASQPRRADRIRSDYD
jgi:hypothetical protein